MGEGEGAQFDRDYPPQCGRAPAPLPRSYVERMNEEDVKRAILVVQQAMTAFAKQAILEICHNEGLNLETFQEPELLVNITKHVLVPQHQTLTKEVRSRGSRVGRHSSVPQAATLPALYVRRRRRSCSRSTS